MNSTIDGRLSRASLLEAEGRFAGAAEEYQALLEQWPDHAGGLHRLGLVMGRLGHKDLELELLGQAIVREPTTMAFQVDFGAALLASGHLDDAEATFREVLRLNPESRDAGVGLAEVLVERGQLDEAEAIARATALVTPRGERLAGRLAAARGRHREAVDHFVDYLKSGATDAAAFFYLGVSLQALELSEPAAASYREALSADPTLFEAWSNLSTVLVSLGRADEALIAAERARELQPNRPGAWLNRANARRDAGDLEGAGADYRRAVELDPSYAEAWSSLGNLYHDLEDWSLALDAHDRAVSLAPEVPQVRWNQSFTLLATGDLAHGWREYEARLLTEAARPEPRSFPWPTWQGEPLDGRRILVYREQGLGDEILFATTIPSLLALGAKVTFLASPRLVTLFQRAWPEVEVRPDQEAAVRPGEAFDWQTPIGSLPRWLRFDRKAFPSVSNLVFRAPEAASKWQGRLATLAQGRKVGICWRSGLQTAERVRHYALLEEWAPLLRLEGITWINLQYDECEEELRDLERLSSIKVHRWPAEDLRDDLENVVGLIGSLDAVVTAPTAVSSLAGAVGVPTWQVDSGADWTVFGDNRSPWFPSLRVVRRRPSDGDWRRVMEATANDLARYLIGGPGRGSAD